MKEYTYKKEKSIAIISSIIFFVLAFILYLILETGGIGIKNIDLPLIYIVNKFGIIYKYIYGSVIIAAIFTSVIAAGYGFIENCSKNKREYKIISILICITAIPISNIGFSYLVSLLYPVFGLLGLIQLVYILLICKRVEKKQKN